MGDRAWKQTERTVAARLRGSRVGCTGAATPDVVNRWLSVEVKTRRRLPAWLRETLAQAVRNASEGTLPLAVLHQAGQRHDNDLVVLTLLDFCEWFGDLSPSEVSEEVAESGKEWQ